MKAGKKKQPLRKSPAVNVESLVQQANIALSKMQPELALQFYQRAMEIERDNTNLMDAAADVHMQLGDFEKAYSLLSRSTQSQPETNICKWFYLAQLQQGMESLSSFQSGIKLVENSLQNPTRDQSLDSPLTKQLVKALCSIADLYLTDLCFEEGAESACEASLSRALSLDPSSLDALQTLTSLRLSQNRSEEASVLIEGVYSRVQGARERVRQRTLMEELNPDLDPQREEEEEDLPDLEFCQSTAKLLVECGEKERERTTEGKGGRKEGENLCELAVELVEGLLEDDDDNVELWYILGVALLSLPSPDLPAARSALERAQEMMSVLREQMGKEFSYTEEERLVGDHLCLLEEMEKEEAGGGGGGEGLREGAKLRRPGFGLGKSTTFTGMEGMEEEEEEEWSTDEEDEEERDGEEEGEEMES